MTDAARQLPLDLGHRTAMGRDDFLIAPSNHDAVAWIDLWPEWPAPTLILYGPIASGKSHLSAVWRERAKADSINARDLNDTTVRDIAARGTHILLDDVDTLIGTVEGEKGLFHLYNIFKEEKRSILLTLCDPPVRRSFALPDLASRLRAAPAVAIREPDDQLLAAVLVKLFNDRQLRVSEDVITYIVPRMDRSFEAARALADRIDKQTLAEKKAVTIPFVKTLLTDGSL
jgi:DnaA regulatory inactivator Hda